MRRQMLINIFVRNSDSSSNDYGAAELGMLNLSPRRMESRNLPSEIWITNRMIHRVGA